MARVGTPNLNLGTWVDGENPGAGDQVTDNTGLNGNFIKLDTAIGAEHNANGSHKDDKIEGRSLKAAIADGATLEATAATGAKTFRVKDSGISAAKLAVDAVETAKIKDSNVTAAKLAADAVETAKIKDANVTAVKLAADAVETAKIKNSNVTTEKLEYKEIIILLSQAGTADPAMTIIKNSSGYSLYASRSSTGVYVVNDGEGGHIFTTGKSIAVHSGISGGEASTLFSTDISVVITTKDFAGAAADSLLNGFSLIVRIYP
jgi:hypothetical protein